MVLTVDHLAVRVEGKDILHDVSFVIGAGEVHALMGPNGSGKSTLANALMGHPRYAITGGNVSVDGQDITAAKPDERAQAGLFLSFQYPVEIPGVSVQNFLRTAWRSLHNDKLDHKIFSARLQQALADLCIDPVFAKRAVNEGFSGGEKKRMEMLQLAVLQPKFAILDETDSGLDVDALKVVAAGIERARHAGIGILLITHYPRLLEYVVPDFVHVLIQGRLTQSGGKDLAYEIERVGYKESAQ
ncbi:MAG: Fe-S cluster assembly ATPase SufC [bacterium]|nr:Fe-S cluster assembly ATPase SufC [bacterium]